MVAFARLNGLGLRNANKTFSTTGLLRVFTVMVWLVFCACFFQLFFFNTFNVVWGWGPEHVCDLSPDLRAQPVS